MSSARSSTVYERGALRLGSRFEPCREQSISWCLSLSRRSIVLFFLSSLPSRRNVQRRRRKYCSLAAHGDLHEKSNNGLIFIVRIRKLPEGRRTLVSTDRSGTTQSTTPFCRSTSVVFPLRAFSSCRPFVAPSSVFPLSFFLMSPFCRALFSLPSQFFPYVALLSLSPLSSLLQRHFVALSLGFPLSICFLLTTPFCHALSLVFLSVFLTSPFCRSLL